MFGKRNSITRNHKKLPKLHTRIYRKTNFFPGQRDSEEVKLCIRTHWVQRAKILLGFLLMGILLPGVILYSLSFVNLPQKIWMILNLTAIVYFIMVWLLTFIEFIKSEMTLLVTTNERIADIIQASLFDRQISETSLDRVQEVSGFTHGILRTFFDVGRLEISTAGSDIPIIIRFVKSPQLTARKILDIQRESQQRRRVSDFGKRKSDQLKTRKNEQFSQEELKEMRSDDATDDRQQRKPDTD